MTLLSITMLFASLLFLYLIFRGINKNTISFDLSFLWIVIGLVFIVFSIFNEIPLWLAHLLGFKVTSNFLLSLFVFFLLIVVFLHSIQLSNQKEQIKRLVQELSLTKKSLSEIDKSS